MLDQSYSESNLRRLLHPIDFVRYPLTNDNFWIKNELGNISRRVNENKIDYNTFDLIRKRKFDFYKCNSFDTDIVLRKLDNNVKRLYKIKQSDRTEIVRQVKSVLSDETPISVARLDISSFYESINKDNLIKKLNDDYLLSPESKFILNNLFNNNYFLNRAGLPRGIGISATLSEMYLRNLDKFIIRTPGVIYYARYVDDILVISCNDSKGLIKSIDDRVIKLGLKLNTNKCNELQLPDKGAALCDCVTECNCNSGFEYLGYRFSFPKTIKKHKKRYVVINLAKSKSSKIKTRLVYTFLDYASNRDFRLLEMRLQYLSGNYLIPLTKSGKELKGGIFYHYPLLTGVTCLKDITNFLRRLIFSRSGSLGVKIDASLTNSKRKHLLRYTFEGGYKKRIMHKLTPQEIGSIKECWRNE